MNITMRGKFNPKTKQYENYKGEKVLQERDGYSSEDIKELKAIETRPLMKHQKIN